MEGKGPELKLHSKFKASLGYMRPDSTGACRFTIPETTVAACGGWEGVMVLTGWCPEGEGEPAVDICLQIYILPLAPPLSQPL